MKESEEQRQVAPPPIPKREGVEGGPKPQLLVIIIIIGIIVIGYTSLSRNQVVLLVDLSNIYLYPVRAHYNEVEPCEICLCGI